MLRFTLQRIALIVPLLFVIITLTFFLVRLAPGSPLATERGLPPEIRANLERHYGLDRPWFVQYGNYLRGLLRFDLGPSYKYKDVSVNDLIRTGLPISARLGLFAYVLALGIGLPLGIVAALRRGTKTDRSLVALAVLGISFPNFAIGPLLILVFGMTLGWLPPAGWGEPEHFLLPVVTLALPYVGYIARLTRGGILDVLQHDHIQTARAKGLSERRVILRHALRAGLLPVVSFSGPALAFLLTGTVVVERIFAIPGLGSFFVQAAFNRDYTLVLGIAVLVSTAMLMLNLLVDMVYGLLDPRIRYGER
jgi:oligopeptide transport system permease protein